MQVEINDNEQRAWQVFSQLLGYKDNAFATGQELATARQKIIDLQLENRRITEDADKRVREIQRASDERVAAGERRILVLQSDFDEAQRELTEITTRAYMLQQDVEELIAAAAASRHAPKTPAPSRDPNDIEGAMSGLFRKKRQMGEVHVPEVVPMRTQNMLDKFMDDREEDDVPSVLLKGPMKPEEREPVSEKALLARLSEMVSPTTAPEQQKPVGGWKDDAPLAVQPIKETIRER